jgi:hypothetical protein
MGIGATIVDALTGGALGGVTGVIGTGVSAYVAYKNKKLDHEHEIAMADKETAHMLAEADKAIDLQKFKTEGEVEIREADAFTASVKNGMKNLFKTEYAKFLPDWVMAPIAAMFAMVDMLRSSVRPVVTYFLVVVATFIALKVAETRPEIIKDQAANILMSLSYLTVTCVTWWFGDRRLAKVLTKSL